MHPLVRDLYKRVLLVGRDYPHPQGLAHVRHKWKAALRNPENCPSCYTKSDCTDGGDASTTPGTEVSLSNHNITMKCEKELHKAVARGRYMVREMIGVIQLKKYRTMKARYDNQDNAERLQQAMD